MQDWSSSLFNRPDTLLGICEGIGQDFGFNANFLRIPLAVLMLWNPVVILATYAALGLAVAVSRLAAPGHQPRAIGGGGELALHEGANDEAPALAAA